MNINRIKGENLVQHFSAEKGKIHRRGYETNENAPGFSLKIHQTLSLGVLQAQPEGFLSDFLALKSRTKTAP
jgi:hypothetical protein